MSFKIRDLIIDNKVCLAPMAGISNSAFRRIVKEMGCALVFAEMVSDKAIVYKNVKTRELLYATDSERPIAQQIFGSDKVSLVASAKIIYEIMRPDIIDINMGCPVPKVAIRTQAGASLLKDINKIYDIVSAVVEAVPCPVTVKIRSGWDANSINAVEVAKVCEQAGASAITVHPRTRSQGYSGKADWNVIKQVKDNIAIPVIGNGDIRTPEDAKRMIDETRCDAIMIGRGVLGNPWIIRDTIALLDGKIGDDGISYKDKIDMALKHMTYLSEIRTEKQTVLEMRGHLAWYIKGLPRSNEVKELINKESHIIGIKNILSNYLKELIINE